MSASPSPLIKTGPTHSLFTRLKFYFNFSFIKFLLGFSYRMQAIRPPPADVRPTYTKYYPDLPSLVVHVFIPPAAKSDPSARFPLLIDVHGGGFCIGHPSLDDPDNAFFAYKHNILVVSINYRKAPEAPFPLPPQDVGAQMRAVLDDTSLPRDKSKGVAVIGYSAGGNLAFAGPIAGDLVKEIKGTVAYYPSTDPGRGSEERMKGRVKPEGREDILDKMVAGFGWAYMPLGTDLKDPRLGPLWAERSQISEKVYILGCEWDLLCKEAEELAEKLAKAEEEKSGSGKGKVEEEGEGWKGWSVGGVRWENLLQMEHGYNMRWKMEKDQTISDLWKRRTEEVHGRVAEWLWREVYN